ncbi:MAG TPA: hypothetical protein VFL80_03970 [Thermoanaerobaculia bacterium]|nr:hypothetical protein [Thermoanaerobaculia bacterium]
MAGASAALMLFTLARDQRADAAHFREVRMEVELRTIRSAIRSYQQKNGRYPAALHDLVRDGQIRSIPPDPVTRAATWGTILEERVAADDFGRQGSRSETVIVDVRSTAPGRDSKGKLWSEY